MIDRSTPLCESCRFEELFAGNEVSFRVEVAVRRPRVSVVIPAYNAADFIAAALDSVLNQTFRDIEILVIDDGSSDDTGRICASYGAQIRVLRTPNQRVARARNTGIEAATGEFVAFLDADDLWEPDKLARQIAAVTERVRFVYTDTISFGMQTMSGMRMSDGRSLPTGNILAPLVRGNFVATSSVLLDRQIALAAGGFDPSLSIAEDWLLWIRVAHRTQAACIEEPLVRYRIRPGSLGGDPVRRMLDSAVVIEQGLRLIEAGSLRKAQIRRQALGDCYGYAATLAIVGERNLLALRYSLAALVLRPSPYHFKQLVKAMSGRRGTELVIALKAALRRNDTSAGD